MKRTGRRKAKKRSKTTLIASGRKPNAARKQLFRNGAFDEKASAEMRGFFINLYSAVVLAIARYKTVKTCRIVR
jgi:hypothetical protein